MIRELANTHKRMAFRDPLLGRGVGEQRAHALLLASHPRMGNYSLLAVVAGLFSKLPGRFEDQKSLTFFLNAKKHRNEQYKPCCHALRHELLRKTLLIL
jgi:hypothetical protein